MSLFQCNKCGCEENTALSSGSWGLGLFDHHGADPDPNVRAAAASYREVLGLAPGSPFGKLCSACSPLWYGAGRGYGVGPNPNPTKGHGLWHGHFSRDFLPKGQFTTNREGNLVHKVTGEPAAKYHRATEYP